MNKNVSIYNTDGGQELTCIQDVGQEVIRTARRFAADMGVAVEWTDSDGRWTCSPDGEITEGPGGEA